MVVFGLAFGRWWRTALAIAALGWPAVLIAMGIVDTLASSVAAAGLSLLNAGLGVLVHQGLLRLARQTRATSRGR
jgi:hypothetical protein